MVYRLSVVVILGLFTGCGGTQSTRVDYDATQDRTVYRARPMSLPIDKRDSGYGSRFRELRLHLQADCEGRECRPEQAQLRLSTSGGSELHISDRTLVIVADEEQFTWKDADYERRERPKRIVGTVLHVTVDIDRLRKMASAKTIEGKVGSVELKISGRDQERLRAFLRQMGYEMEPI